MVSDLKAGTHKGFLVDWKVVESSLKKSKGVATYFGVEQDGHILERKQEKIFWLTGGAKQRSIENLYKLGFKDDFDGLAKGAEGKALTNDLEVRLVCDGDPVEIQWVNLPDEVHGLQTVAPAKGILDDLKADFLSNKPVTAASLPGKKKLDIRD